ncbi:hypothetical protein EAE96_009003 [Botrytis aclada]|nr:hypothetical protein EAE96_009003 [Botrytis aclada]
MPSLFNRTPVEVRQRTEIDLLRRKVTALEKEVSAEKKNVASYVKSEKDTLATWRKYVEKLFRGLREDYANLQESLERTEANYRNKMGLPRYEREGFESGGVDRVYRDDIRDMNSYGAQRNEFDRESNRGEGSYGVRRNQGGQTGGAKSSQAKEEGIPGSQGPQGDRGTSNQGSGKDLVKQEDQGSKDGQGDQKETGGQGDQKDSGGQGDQNEKVDSEAQGDQGFGNGGAGEVQADSS